MADLDTVSQLADYPPFPRLVPQGTLCEGRYEVRFAQSMDELDAILRLRFEVFNLELGEGLETSFETGRDIDAFDAGCHHLVVIDRRSNDAVVGTYRIQTSAMAECHRGFYSATEYALEGLGPAVLGDAVELGRACVALDHRNTQVLFLLWRGLAMYVRANRKRFLFGCCSLTSQDPVEARAVMGYLEAHGHVHPEVRVEPIESCRCYPAGFELDPSFAVKLPKLFRIYLRHGAKVCSAPAIDRLFKTIDYLVLFDVEAMSARQVKTFFG